MFVGKYQLPAHLRPDPERYAHLPPEQNPYSGLSPLDPEVRAKLYPNDEMTQKAKAKPHGQITAREMGHIGGSIGGPIVRYLIELGKIKEAEIREQRLRQQRIDANRLRRHGFSRLGGVTAN